MIRALLILALLAGCAAPSALAVRGHGKGWGVPISRHQFVVTAHQAGPRMRVLVDGEWWPAKEVERWSRDVEDLVVYETKATLAPAESRVAKDGDSGTPLVAGDGRALGVLAGQQCTADGVCVLFVIPLEVRR